MADEPENHTLALLRELRDEFAEFRSEVRESFELLHLGFERLHLELAARCRPERPPTEPKRIAHWNTRKQGPNA